MSAIRAEPRLASARDALARGDWEAARAAFEQALAEEETAEAQEGLSWAALALDDGEAALHARQAAYRLYRQVGDDVSSARMAMWAGKDHEDFRGELAVARGWRQRARRLLEGQPIAPEHGWLPLLECWASLNHGEDPDMVRRCASEARAVSVRIDDSDIGILALAAEGLALVGEGRVDDGMKRLDEAAAAVFADELTQEIWRLPVFCWLIYACERVRDFARAAEWCELMREAADRVQHTASKGVCRAHYAAVLTSRGKWMEAEATLLEAAAWFEASWPPHVAEVNVRLAELRRRQGRSGEAAELLRQYEWHPLAALCLAELAFDDGRLWDAEALIERFLRHVPERNRLGRAAGLEALARISVSTGNEPRADEAIRELETAADAAGTGPLRGATCLVKAVRALDAGDPDRGRICLEDAVAWFERSGTPFEAADARLRLADVLISFGHVQRAQAEVLAAQQVLEPLEAKPLLRKAEALLGKANHRVCGTEAGVNPPALTPRQIEVLRLVAQGMSDCGIAATLGISEHTVHRHVANILLRLDAPTRAAAATQATSQGLI